MVVSPAPAMLFAVMTVFACAETVAAKARARHPAVSHSSKVAQPTKPPVPHAPAQDEKAWMERASAPSNGAGGGM